MLRSMALLVVAMLLGAVLLTSCAEQQTVETEPMVAPPPDEGVAAEPAPAAEGEGDIAAATEAGEMDADAVVAEVGAPVYEGATAQGVEVVDGKTRATFTTPASYQEVKEYYMGTLGEPEWTNNGMEMGAVGGDEWEWKSADGNKYVMVKRDSGASETQIRFTLKPAA